MWQKELEKAEEQMTETVEFFLQEIKNLKTGRATPALVEDIKVDYFGAVSPIKQVAAISLEGFKTIVIAPWNRDNLVDIEKAIRQSDLNLNPNNDGKVVRLILPDLTEDRRRDLVKVLGKKTEEARIKVRKAREEFGDFLKEQDQKGSLPEDGKFQAKEALQKLVNQFNERIETERAKKEKEIMAV